jgi:hypothetical protein
MFPEEGKLVRADDCIYIKHMKLAEKDGAARHVRIL